MKNLYCLFFLLFLFGAVNAQEKKERGERKRMTVEERAQRTTEWMKNTLDLTEAQIAPVDSINLLFVKAQHILFQTSEGDRAKIKDALEALEEQKIVALGKVLTPEQMKTYKEKSDEMRKNFRNRDGKRGRRPAPAS